MEQLLNISDAVFGEGYLTEDSIKLYKRNPYASILKLEKDGVIQGFSMLQLLSLNELQKELFVDLPNDLKGFSKIGYRKMTAVHPKFKRLGLGIKLFEEGQKWLKDQHIDAVVTVSWINPKTLKFRRFIESNGFKPIQKLKGYWHQDSLDRNYNCLACGAPPCHCSGMLYIKI